MPDGEPPQHTEAWSRLVAAMAARRRVAAPPGLGERIMAAIGELPLA